MVAQSFWKMMGFFAVTAAAAPTIISPMDPAFQYSPWAWQLTKAAATTVNPGSYFKILFESNTASLQFDVSQMVAMPSQLYWRIDNGPMTQELIRATIPLTIPANLTKGDVPYHLLEVIVKSMTESENRWLTGQVKNNS